MNSGLPTFIAPLGVIICQLAFGHLSRTTRIMEGITALVILAVVDFVIFTEKKNREKA